MLKESYSVPPSVYLLIECMHGVINSEQMIAIYF